jgi:hypothetical protein
VVGGMHITGFSYNDVVKSNGMVGAKKIILNFSNSPLKHSSKQVSIPSVFEKLSTLFMVSKLFIISTGSTQCTAIYLKYMMRKELLVSICINKLHFRLINNT